MDHLRGQSLQELGVSCVKQVITAEARLVQQPLQEDDIIELHKLFLTPGCHHINVASVELGRKLITTLLTSLNYYKDIACITTEHTLPAGIHDCVLNLMNASYVESFLCEHYQHDFVWIEQTESLLAASWYAALEYELTNIQPQLPIIMVSYQRTTQDEIK